MKRMVKVLMVALLVTVILVASVSPAMARRGNFGHRMPTDRPCEVAKGTQDKNGARHEFDPDGHVGCWVVVPGLSK
jgi:hypothetical protein